MATTTARSRRKAATTVAAFVALLSLAASLSISRAQPSDGSRVDLFVPLGDTGSLLGAVAETGLVVDDVALPAGSTDDGVEGIVRSSPWAAAIGPDGLVYVSDAGAGTIERFDPDAGATIDTPITADGLGLELESDLGVGVEGGDEAARFVPRGLAFGPEGRLYVVDAGGAQVLGFSPVEDSGPRAVPDLIISPSADHTTSDGELVDPVAIVVAADGSLLVSDRGDDDIERYDALTGDHLGTLVTLEPGDAPAGMVLTADGRLLVVLSGRGAVVAVDPTTGETDDEALIDDLANPTGVAVDTDGALWISDPWTGRVTAHDPHSGQPTGTELDLGGQGGPRLLAAAAPAVAPAEPDPDSTDGQGSGVEGGFKVTERTDGWLEELGDPEDGVEFAENEGQADADVDYAVLTEDYDAVVVDGDVALVADGTDAADAVVMEVVGGAEEPDHELLDESPILTDEDPAEDEPASETGWFEPAPGRLADRIRPKAEPERGERVDEAIEFEDVLPGIDVVYSANGDDLEYSFVIDPGADPDEITLDFDNAVNVTIEPNGDLLIEAETGPDYFSTAPVTYQPTGEDRLGIDSAYVLRPDGSVGFTLGDHDPALPVIIDPTFVAADTADNAFSGSSFVVPVPSEASVGDLLLAHMSYKDDSGSTITPPAGWTSIEVRSHASKEITHGVFWRVATAGEPASYSFTVSGSNADMAGAIAAFQNVDTSDPIDAFGSRENGDGGSLVAPSITTTEDDVTLVALFAVLGSGVTPPSGMVERWDEGGASEAATAGAEETFATAGSTGTRTATTGSSDGSIGALLALNPGNRIVPATGDSASASQDKARVVDVAANDVDTEGDAVTAIDVTDPANGSTATNGNGTVTYTPDPAYVGADTFDYWAIDAGASLGHFWGLAGDGTDAVANADGTLTGTTTVTGNFGQALFFDEVDDRVTVPDVAYGDDFTLSFDFKIDDNTGSLFQYVYSHGAVGTANSINVFFVEDAHGTDPNKIRTAVTDTDDGVDPYVSDIDIAALVGDGQWHTYTLAVGDGGLAMFLDGVLQATDPTRGTAGLNPAGSLYLGSREDINVDRYYGGSLDSVQLYDRRLDGAEIAALASASNVATVSMTVVACPTSDSDSDGVNDCGEDADTDGDNDPATNPGPDTDGDTTPNYLDADDDGDGIATSAENADPNGDGDPRDARDVDRDGQPDYLDLPTGAAVGQVGSEQKVSDTQGGLVATLDDADNFGYSVAAVGDLDGDGVVDVAVGATSDDDGGSGRGAVYLLFMNADGTVKAEQKISDTVGGLAAPLVDADSFGSSVAAVGDLDGDGLPDLAVGSSGRDDGGTGRGAVYILFLNADGTVKAEQRISDTVGGLAASLGDGDGFGIGVAGLGDLDGDGLPDLAVGAFSDDDGGTNRGAVHVLFLNADGTVKGEQKISDTAGGLTAVLDDNDLFGFDVTALGDLDGDTLPDLAVSAYRDDDGGTDRGAVHVLFLNANGTVKGEQKVSASAGGLTGPLDDTDYFGTGVAGLGDIDDDGLVDLAVGVFGDDDGGTGRGAVYVLTLDSGGTVKEERKISATSGDLTGPIDDSDFFGYRVAGLGDLDEDGTIDLAVGAFGDDDGGSARGAVYMIDLTTACPATDSDSDGLHDCREDANTDDDDDPSTNPGPDTDGDTTPNHLDADDDGDGTATSAENADPNGDGDPGDAIDTDRDGRPDYLDLPTSSTGGTVATEQKISSTSGGLVGPLDDGDAFGDGVEAIGDLDDDGVEDLAVGARYDDDGGDARGAVHILFMNADGTVASEQKISDTAGGFTTTLDQYDYFGDTIAALGDIDGDGVEDIAVGAYGDDDGGTNRGAVYILRLNTDGTVKAEQKISDLSGGLTATLDNDDSLGVSVTGIGDLDGDGIGDLVAAANADDDGGTNRGAVHVLFLDADGTVKAEQKISSTTGGGPVLDDYDVFGMSVAGLGDVDGDGTMDLAVGAHFDDDGGSNRGAIHILFLDTDGTASSSQKISETQGGFTEPLTNNDHFGYSVAGVGDLDGDGIPDLVSGAIYDDDGGNARGAVHVMRLDTDGTVKSSTKISSTTGNLTGPLDDNDQLGRDVAGIGDLDGDGTIGIAVGAIGDDDGGAGRGAVYLIDLIAADCWGDADGDGLLDCQEDANTDADGDPTTNPGPDTDGDTTANYLDADDDGDGTATSAENADPNGDGDPRDAIDSDHDGQPDYLDAPTSLTASTVGSEQKISATAGGLTGPLDGFDLLGQGVVPVGDIDGDGVVDLAVGAYQDDDGGSARGAVYILFLNADGTVKAEQKISSTQGGLTGPLDDSDQFGRNLASLGDIDGDGIGDLGVGAFRDDDGGTNRGAVYVLFLNADGTVKAEQKISDNAGGFTTTLGGSDEFGRDLAGIGDVDGDGIGDLAVGASLDDDGGGARGAVYVLFLNSDGTVKGEQKISSTQGGLTGPLDDSDEFGIGLAGVGDLDGDGVRDLVAGAHKDDDGGSSAGALYVLFLNANGTVKAEQKISATTGGLDASLDVSDTFGAGVGALGDLDGDGVVDLAVGAPGDDDGAGSAGAVYIVHLRTNGTVKAEQKISATSGGLAATLDSFDSFGHGVAPLGDLDADGTIHLAVGANGDDDGASSAGAVHILELAAQTAVTVNSTGDATDASPGDHICDTGGTNADGDAACTLRAAIAEANASAQIDTINFDLPTTDANHSSGVWSISPGSTYPSISGQTDLDATTQQGWTVDPVVVVDGSSVGGTGLELSGSSAGSTIAGLAIHSFGGSGIAVGTSTNVITGNRIGTDHNDTSGLGNSSSGIYLWGGTGNRVGGTGGTDGNVIVDNADGVVLEAGTEATILGNDISGQTDLGIDLANDGTTANDGGDGDSGPNDLLNYPVITDVSESGGTLTADFDLDIPAGNYRVEFFTNPSGPGSGGYGEGEQYTHAASITHTGSGAESFSTSFAGAPIDVVTATTTADLGGGSFGATSEFSLASIPAIALTVNSTGDTDDNTPGDGACDTGAANSEGADECTLRAAITEANGSIADYAVSFAIPASDPNHAAGLWTITPASALATITGQTTIDAQTQTGWTTTPVVEVDAGATAPGSDGLRIDSGSDGVTIRGLAILDAPNNIIEVRGGTGHLIAGNHLGADAAGTTATNNGNGAVVWVEGGSAITIGGTTATQRNVIVDGPNGIVVDGNNTVDGVTISGNHIGVDVGGNSSIGTIVTDGVRIEDGATNVVVGGSAAGAGNVVGGTGQDGVQVWAEATDGVVIEGNSIGIGADGTTALSIGGDGVLINDGPDGVSIIDNVIGNTGVVGIEFDGNSVGGTVQGNLIGIDGSGNAHPTQQMGVLIDDAVGNATGLLIGGTGAGDGNTIANAGGGGVWTEGIYQDSTGDNAFLGNSIHDNPGLGIDLHVGGSGVTANDADDVDTGPNGYLNFPVITDISSSGGTLTVDYTLDVAPGDYRIEFFVNTVVDDSGHGEGQTFAGTQTITHTGSGSEAFSTSFSGAVADLIAATTTQDLGGGTFGATSEFSGGASVAVTVNSTGDATDTSPGDRVCDTGADNADGHPECTLRAAIAEANASSIVDEIEFAIPATDGGFVAGSPSYWVIAPTGTQYGSIQVDRLDATTQTGWAGTPIVELDGSAFVGSEDGLAVDTAGMEVRGLSVTNWPDDGAHTGSDGTVLAANWFGVDPAGAPAINHSTDLLLYGGAAGVVVGGNTAADGNVFAAGASDDGVLVTQSATGTLIANNRFGIGADGTTDLGAVGEGVAIWDGHSTTVSDNVFGFFSVAGVAVGASSNGTVITGNTFGLDDLNGPAPMAQALWYAGSGSVRFGGTGAGEGNTVRNASWVGVELNAAATGDVTVLGNSITGSSSLGIDLNSDGVTANDGGDADTGPNDLLNFPVFTDGAESGGTVTMTFDLDVPVHGDGYRIEFFANSTDGIGADGHGEGETLLGSVDVAGSVTGSTFAYPGSVGDVVSATTTQKVGAGFGPTSEYSMAYVVNDGTQTVNSTGDGDDQYPGNGSCDTGGTNSEGNPECTLRAAITEANASTLDMIDFAIPTSDPNHTSTVWTLSPATALPDVTSTVDLDATTQPGWTTSPVIVIDGSATPVATDGLRLQVGGSTVSGLSIVDFPDDGIDLAGTGGHTVTSSYLGLRADGTTIGANGGEGVLVTAGSNGNTIGGATAADGNVMAGNTSDGVDANGTGTTIENNRIGTDATGLLDRGNGGDGIDLTSADSSTIRDNVISGNGDRGIDVLTSDNLVIVGNLIGVGADGNTGIGNASDGIRFGAGASTGSMVGGTGGGDPNTIANNGDEGIDFQATGDNSAIGNAINGNGSIGIGLGADNAVTANDSGDGDSGANGLLNHPEITSAIDVAGTVTLNYALDVPAGDYRVELFLNPSGADPSGHGEGESFHAAHSITHTGSGVEAFVTTYSGSLGQMVTSTASEDLGGGSYGATSEFSANATVTSVDFMVNSTGDASDASAGNGVCDTGGTNSEGDPECTLRAAIEELNGIGGNGSAIRFAIPISDPGYSTGPVAFTLTPASSYPVVGQQITIDGSSQSQYASQSPPRPVIVLDGSGAGAGVDALYFGVGTDGSVVNALTIHSYDQMAIEIVDSDNHVITGNILGLEADGSTAAGNRYGIYTDTAVGLTIGGDTATERNVISDNDWGMALYNDSNDAVITGNYVGTDLTGLLDRGNRYDGIYVVNASSRAQIGGPTAAEANVASGNGGDGIYVGSGSMVDPVIQGNLIGVGSDGTTALANDDAGLNLGWGVRAQVLDNVIGPGTWGILIANHDDAVVTGNFVGTDAAENESWSFTSAAIEIGANTDDATIGGTTAAAANVVRGGTGAGVEVMATAGTGNTIIGNSIVANTGPGIDLVGGTETAAGVTANDAGDADSGPNDLLNRPAISRSVETAPGSLTTTFELDAPAGTYRIELFRAQTSGAIDDSEAGEGEELLGTGTATHTGSGSETFTIVHPGAAGQLISATATVDLGAGDFDSTSEFSRARTALSTVQVAVNDTGDAGDLAAGDGVCDTGTFNGEGEVACTLRAAIEEVNGAGGIAAIHFDLATSDANHSSGVWTAGPSSGLPSITEAVTIDATTQPGWSTAPVFELDGVAAGTSSGLEIDSSNVVVRAMAITRFAQDGIRVSTSAAGTVIAGNHIGLDASGLVDRGNTSYGVNLVSGTTGTTIGGVSTDDRNVISGNGSSGIQINGSNSNTVVNNYVGTDVTGNASGIGIGNGAQGINLTGADTNAIGQAGAGNVVSGNGDRGVRVVSGTGNTIRANTVGLGLDGTTAVANGTHGVMVSGTSSGTIIGGSGAGQGNVVSGNTSTGVYIDGSSGASTTSIVGNTIGLDVGATMDRGNGLRGVQVAGATADTTIGGATAAHGNVIGGNDATGVWVSSALGTGTVIQNNLIGTDGAGGTAVANDGSGISTMGVDTDIFDNLISGNAVYGVLVDAATDTVLLRNRIGTDTAGTSPVPNTSDGVHLRTGDTGTILGSATNGNVIAGNGRHGIYVRDGAAPVIAGNNIGTDSGGTIDLGNTSAAVEIDTAAAGLRIGGTGAGDGNVIANNGDGIRIAAGAGATVLGNQIHSNDDIGLDLAADGVTANDAGDVDTGANDLLNFPVIDNVQRVAGDLVVDLTLDVAAGDHRIGLFANSTADPSGNGEGETPLGGTTITHTGSGAETFQVSVTSAATILTATATEDLGGGSFGSTSEFSASTPSPDLVIVNSSGDNADTSVGDGQCDTGGTNASGDPECTLRAAMAEANDATTPVDTIWFSIPATDPGHTAGVWTIAPTSALPMVTDVTSIDGSTQAGWAATTQVAPTGLDGTQVLVLDGAGAGPVSGLVVAGDASTIRGLAIGGFTSHGIEVTGDGVSVTAVYVGTDSVGTTANANGGDGIHVTGANVIIGGAAPGDRVLAAGNGDDGIGLAGATASGATVTGSIIGYDATGATVLANGAAGIQVDDASGVRVGGVASGEANIISGNTTDGVRVTGNPASVAVLANTMVANGLLAIDLGADGVTANDGGDGDTGPNGLLNAPTLVSVDASGGVLDVDYTLDVPTGTYRVELFANPGGADGSGHGEAGTLIGADTVVHTGGGSMLVSAGLPGTASTVVTATATEDLGGGSYGYTSEASNAVTAVDRSAQSVLDASVRRSDAMAAGGLDPAAAATTGAAGEALAFDGTDDRLLGPGLDVTAGALTVGAWVRADTLTGVDRVISKRDGAGNPIYELSVDGATGEAVATIRVGGGGVTARGGTVGTGAWHQLLATWDGTDLILHVDGAEVDRTGAVGTLAVDVDTPAAIGNTADATAGFDGRIDHAMVTTQTQTTDRVLTDRTAATSGASLVSVGGQQTGAAGAWTVSATQTRSGGYSLLAPETPVGAGTAWAVATGIDEVGTAFRSWWWLSTDTGIDLAAGTRAGVVPTDEMEGALTSPSGWLLRHRSGPIETVDAAAAGTPTTGTWVEVEIQTDQDGDSRLLIDGVEVTGWTAQGSDPASGSVGLRAGLLPTGERWYIDDPRARKLVTPEPIATVGPLDRQ